jgi:hypothetical protein
MIELAVFSAVVLLLSLAGIVWDIASGLLVSGIDGILLLAIALMMAGIAALVFVGELKQLRALQQSPAGAQPAPAPTQPASAPAAGDSAQ